MVVLVTVLMAVSMSAATVAAASVAVVRVAAARAVWAVDSLGVVLGDTRAARAAELAVVEAGRLAPRRSPRDQSR